MEKLIYAGDKTPIETWDLLKADTSATLVDVRTEAEWNFVGMPDLSKLNKNVIYSSWQLFPEMSHNSHFVNFVSSKVGSNKSALLLFLCRSGVRSRFAAHAMHQVGYSHCFNILEGFEGSKDGSGHRGKRDGWKFHNLPWKQT